MQIEEKIEGMTHEELSMELFKTLPEDQVKRVMNQKMVDIEPQFLGFIGTYYYLSKMIPKHFTVIDLGCSYNPQCFYFTEHKKYIAVDLSIPPEKLERFRSDNCEIFDCSIENYIKNHISGLNLQQCFAICNYVPPWGGDNRKMVREVFENCYIYYPNSN